ncbi:hypothetical protein ACTFIZ_008112 [Dictyostelium cf. discoideum]
MEFLHVIKMDGSRYVDISKMSSNEEKLVFIRNKVKSKTYVNDHSYNKNAFLLNGLVIISELGESVFHGKVVIEMNKIILIYYITNPAYIAGTGTSDIIINENTVYNPDGSFGISPPQFSPRVLLVFEVNYKSKSIGQSKKLCAVVFDRSFSLIIDLFTVKQEIDSLPLQYLN